MVQKLKNLVVEEEGQALTEYGLIVGLIVIGCIASIKLIGPKVAKFFSDIAAAL
ncbi:Flp family type IVb pilin [Neobacillus drentensis]|uniref:Flp family type IVb pilin n=1 Tax=Neobacillus drentensis TaxID=220684 RepID=UPI000824CF58|nr:pilus assembly protein [Neobacillus drentensis]